MLRVIGQPNPQFTDITLCKSLGLVITFIREVSSAKKRGGASDFKLSTISFENTLIHAYSLSRASLTILLRTSALLL